MLFAFSKLVYLFYLQDFKGQADITFVRRFFAERLFQAESRRHDAVVFFFKIGNHLFEIVFNQLLVFRIFGKTGKFLGDKLALRRNL